MTYRTEADAELIAAALARTDDDGWTYRVRKYFGGWRVIAFDVDGLELGPIP